MVSRLTYFRVYFSGYKNINDKKMAELANAIVRLTDMLIATTEGIKYEDYWVGVMANPNKHPLSSRVNRVSRKYLVIEATDNEEARKAFRILVSKGMKHFPLCENLIGSFIYVVKEIKLPGPPNILATEIKNYTIKETHL